MTPERTSPIEQGRVGKLEMALGVLNYIRTYEMRQAEAARLARLTLGSEPIGAGYSLRNPQIAQAVVDHVNIFLDELGGIEIPAGLPGGPDQAITLRKWAGRKNDNPQIHGWLGYSASPHTPQPSDEPQPLNTYWLNLEEVCLCLSNVPDRTEAQPEQPPAIGQYL